MNHEFKQFFESYYSFVDFAKATGLKNLELSKAYNNFRLFSYELTKNDWHLISEAFEIWSRKNLTD